MSHDERDEQTAAILARELQARREQLEDCQRELAAQRAACRAHLEEADQQRSRAEQLAAELELVSAELAQAREGVARFEAELHAVLTSRTWRWSEPTRAAVRLLLGL